MPQENDPQQNRSEKMKDFVKVYKDEYTRAGGKKPLDDVQILAKLQQRNVVNEDQATQAAQQDAKQ